MRDSGKNRWKISYNGFHVGEAGTGRGGHREQITEQSEHTRKNTVAAADVAQRLVGQLDATEFVEFGHRSVGATELHHVAVQHLTGEEIYKKKKFSKFRKHSHCSDILLCERTEKHTHTQKYLTIYLQADLNGRAAAAVAMQSQTHRRHAKHI